MSKEEKPKGEPKEEKQEDIDALVEQQLLEYLAAEEKREIEQPQKTEAELDLEKKEKQIRDETKAEPEIIKAKAEEVQQIAEPPEAKELAKAVDKAQETQTTEEAEIKRVVESWRKLQAEQLEQERPESDIRADLQDAGATDIEFFGEKGKRHARFKVFGKEIDIGANAMTPEFISSIKQGFDFYNNELNKPIEKPEVVEPEETSDEDRLAEIEQRETKIYNRQSIPDLDAELEALAQEKQEIKARISSESAPEEIPPKPVEPENPEQITEEQEKEKAKNWLTRKKDWGKEKLSKTGEFIKESWRSKDVRNQYFKIPFSAIATRLGIRSFVLAEELIGQSKKAKGQRAEIEIALNSIAEAQKGLGNEEKIEKRKELQKKLDILDKKREGKSLNEEDEKRAAELNEELLESKDVRKSVRELNLKLKTLEQEKGLRTKSFEGKELKYKIEDIEKLQKELGELNKSENTQEKVSERDQKIRRIKELFRAEKIIYKPGDELKPEEFERAIAELKDKAKKDPKSRVTERSAEMKQLRNDLAVVLKNYRRQRGEVDQQETEDVGKIILADIKTKVRGVDLARESLNSALVAGTGLAVAGSVSTGGLAAMPALATMRVARLAGYAGVSLAGRGAEEYGKIKKQDRLKSLEQKGAQALKEKLEAMEKDGKSTKQQIEQARRNYEKLETGLSNVEENRKLRIFKKSLIGGAQDIYQAIKGDKGSQQRMMGIARAMGVVWRYGALSYGINAREGNIGQNFEFRDTGNKILDQMGEQGFVGSLKTGGRSFIDNAQRDLVRLGQIKGIITGQKHVAEQPPSSWGNIKSTFSEEPEEIPDSGKGEYLASEPIGDKVAEEPPIGPLESVNPEQGPPAPEAEPETIKIPVQGEEAIEISKAQLQQATVTETDNSIEKVFQNQLNADKNLTNKLYQDSYGRPHEGEYTKQEIGALAHRLAEKNGYAKGEESITWVKDANKVAYVLDENGRAIECDSTSGRVIGDVGGEGRELESHEMEPIEAKEEVEKERILENIGRKEREGLRFQKDINDEDYTKKLREGLDIEGQEMLEHQLTQEFADTESLESQLNNVQESIRGIDNFSRSVSIDNLAAPGYLSVDNMPVEEFAGLGVADFTTATSAETTAVVDPESLKNAQDIVKQMDYNPEVDGKDLTVAQLLENRLETATVKTVQSMSGLDEASAKSVTQCLAGKDGRLELSEVGKPSELKLKINELLQSARKSAEAAVNKPSDFEIGKDLGIVRYYDDNGKEMFLNSKVEDGICKVDSNSDGVFDEKFSQSKKYDLLLKMTQPDDAGNRKLIVGEVPIMDEKGQIEFRDLPNGMKMDYKAYQDYLESSQDKDAKNRIFSRLISADKEFQEELAEAMNTQTKENHIFPEFENNENSVFEFDNNIPPEEVIKIKDGILSKINEETKESGGLKRSMRITKKDNGDYEFKFLNTSETKHAISGVESPNPAGAGASSSGEDMRQRSEGFEEDGQEGTLTVPADTVAEEVNIKEAPKAGAEEVAPAEEAGEATKILIKSLGLKENNEESLSKFLSKKFEKNSPGDMTQEEIKKILSILDATQRQQELGNLFKEMSADKNREGVGREVLGKKLFEVLRDLGGRKG